MKTIVMVPTYNERQNIGELIRLLHERAQEAEILVVDDSSPDGTFEEVKVLQGNDNKLHLLLRDRSVKGRGWAGRDGFRKALFMGADFVVEMDSDLSHQPKFVPDLLEPLLSKDADVVIGSRYIKGGRDLDRPFYRQMTSNFAKLYLRWVLGLKVKDPTSGFRAFTSEALQKIKVDTLKARGPFTISEILFRCFQANLRIVEVPIEFIDRSKGISKLHAWTLIQYLARALILRFRPQFHV